MDKNIVLLEGIIGDDFKFAKTVDGNDYSTFTICMNNVTRATRELMSDNDRTFSQSMIRIFVYDKKLVEYLRNVEAHIGCRASIFGKLSSTKNEYKGITYMSNYVVCKDVTIVKTKKTRNNGELQG